MKITINNEEVLCDKNIKITEEMLNTSSTILNNVYPKTWEMTHDYTQYYYPKDYSQCLIWSDKYRDITIGGKSIQNATPTPTNPIPIESLTGNTSVEIPTGKNLVEGSQDFGGVWANDNQWTTDTNTYNGLVVKKRTNAWNGIYKEINVESGKTYYFSLYSKSDTARSVAIYLSGGTATLSNSSSQFNTTTNWERYRIRFTCTASGTIRPRLENTSTISGNYTYICGYMLEESDSLSDYEPYTTQNYNIDLGDIELCSIGTAYDRIYNVGENWYIEKKIGKVVFKGSEYWYYQSASSTPTPRTVIGITDYFQYLSSVDIYLSNYFVYNSATSNRIVLTNGRNIYISLENSLTGVVNGDTNAQRLEKLKEWLNAHNTTVYYVLATTTTTQITNEKLLHQLKTLNHDLLFSGVAKRTGNISLNPYHAHYCDLQVLDYKTLLSEGDMLDFVIADKTVEEAIDMVIDAVSDYGFIKGNIEIPDNFIMGTYNTQEKTAYDVFQYISDITQTKWTTRVINQDTVAIDFYSPYNKAPVGTIESTQQYFKDNNIIDISYNYSTEDYRNKQVLTSSEVVSSISETFRVYADGVNQTYDIGLPIGEISTAYITTSNDFIVCEVITEAQLEQGYSGDIIYNPGDTTFRTEDKLASGCSITLDINLLVPGRQIAMNENEINRISTQNDRKGIISRYEARDDTTSSVELQRIAQSYIEYKGKAEINLTVKTQNVRLCDIGDIMVYNSSLDALSDTYMCKKIDTEMIMTTGDIFYIHEFTNTYNTENAINYFDNQRNKTLGNISDGDTITRNLDIENTLNIVFFDTEVS